MKRFVGVMAVLCLNLKTHQHAFALATTPFQACTFYSPALILSSFAGGAPFGGCASWSAVRGRNGCTKIKGVCPACVKYQGDHVQMWLPEFFVEVTTAPGESVFTLAADGKLLQKQMKLAQKHWEASSLSPLVPATRGQSHGVSNSHFWHGRILVMPYAKTMGSFSPLPGVQGTEIPTCFAGLSEFVPSQWNTNGVDAPYAMAWAPVGAPLCNTPQGATLMGGLEAVKGAVSQVGIGKSFGGGKGEVCARPMGLAEASSKILRPQSDALAPLSQGPLEISSKLCMGGWGNLLPRTGWSVTADPFLSAMQAAYRFTSLSADFSLNDRWKLTSEDKWQLVFPLATPNTCFKPGAPFPVVAPAPLENPSQRFFHETSPLSQRKGTYVIAVWRKRETCQEPLETVGGWSVSHQAHLAKNTALCAAVNAQGGMW